MKAYKLILAKAVAETLTDNRYNQSKSALELGMSRGCFREYMKIALSIGYLEL